MGEDFSKFRSSIKSARTINSADGSYSRWGLYRSHPVRSEYTIEDINNLIVSGNVDELRELSKYYYRVSGIYRNAIDLRANLSLYHTMVVPQYDVGRKISKERLIGSFNRACKFVDNLNVPVNFARITRELFLTGTYNGFLRQDGDGVTIQDLPIRYCRSRFKDYNNLDILEFNVAYFDTIAEARDRTEALNSFPVEVRKAYAKWREGKRVDSWVELSAELGGISFSYGDKTPILIASVPAIFKLEEAVDREAKRDEDELGKLLIQQMPIDSKGQLVFQLDEVADIHESVAEMLQDRDTIDVLTTFGETSLENVQDSTSASQSADRIVKYKDNAYNELGIASLLFNPDGSASLAYAVEKEEAILVSLNNIYASWIRYQINKRFASSNVRFDFEILPTTIFNREKLQSQFFQGAQYGYSKMYAGVAMGIKQMDMISLMSFENECLDMTNKMVPLQSSYTTSGNEASTGRPEMADTEKTEKTVQNLEGQ